MTTPTHALAPASNRGRNLVIQFGLVTIPVKLYNGLADAKTHRSTFLKVTDVDERNETVIDYHPVGVKKYDKVTDFIIESTDDLVKMVETDDGWTELSDEELEAAVTDAGIVSGSADVRAVVPLGLLDTTYLVESWMHVRGAPLKKGKTSVPCPAFDKALGLLLACLAERESAAVLRVGEKWAMLLPDGRMARLRFADEVRQTPPMTPPAHTDAEMTMALKLLDSLPTEPPVALDDVGEKVRAYLASKAGGKVIEFPTAEAPVAPVVDLMAVLAASVEAAEPAPAKAKRARKAS